ncbi:MAG: Asp-tRNA(Asn)/Glu-tRNA(Gln) amidotransferase subunit GatC [Pseudomonadales bacterium]|nr:Asp-tRNA(Asn)/Glu-tRNA(Gln) amidotransferase subunit GatC [Pseudomonadales bacterium]MCP5215895.1 Asp-tRNA(Asn)/Glu-tRNA(Gln) amidotransferase subunit GatC [Pseudomonadales bacterium]
MTIQRTDVQNAAHLARIAIDENDIEGYTQDLANILALVDQMQAVNTDQIEPMAHPTDAVQRLRPDQVTEENQRDYFQQIAPATENGLYLVPRVID